MVPPKVLPVLLKAELSRHRHSVKAQSFDRSEKPYYYTANKQMRKEKVQSV